MDNSGFQLSASIAGWDRFPAARNPPVRAAQARGAAEPYKVISTARMSSLVGLTR